MQSAVAVVVQFTRFKFKANRTPVDFARHVVVQTDGGSLENWRINILTTTVLNALDYQLIYLACELQTQLKNYSYSCSICG